MTDMPETIWAVHDETYGEIQLGRWADTVRYQLGGTEYRRRADIPAPPLSDPRVVALVEALKLMIGYAEGVQEDACPRCGGDCSAENPAPSYCPMKEVASDLTVALAAIEAAKEPTDE